MRKREIRKFSRSRDPISDILLFSILVRNILRCGRDNHARQTQGRKAHEAGTRRHTQAPSSGERGEVQGHGDGMEHVPGRVERVGRERAGSEQGAWQTGRSMSSRCRREDQRKEGSWLHYQGKLSRGHPERPERCQKVSEETGRLCVFTGHRVPGILGDENVRA